MIFPMVLLSMSCATSTVGRALLFCNGMQSAITVSKDDKLTDKTAREILALNRKHTQYCGGSNAASSTINGKAP